MPDPAAPPPAPTPSPASAAPAATGPLVLAEGVTRTFAGRRLLDAQTLAVAEGERVSLVGANGAGKTTLLRLLAGLDPPEEGRVARRRGLRLAYLEQETLAGGAGTVAEALRAGQADQRARLADLTALDELLAHAPGAAERARLLERRAALEDEVERLGGHDPDRAIEVAASDLGLPPPERAIETLSGGERRRVALARVLLARPDLLLLDEPTNHLDAETIERLAERLSEGRAGAVFVAHDRAFIDDVATRIVEVDRGRLHAYEGGYARFLERKALREEREGATDLARRAYLRSELRWLASGCKAQRRKGKERVARAESLAQELGKAPPVPAEMEFRLPSGPRLGEKVLELREVGKSLGGRKLFSGITLRLAAGDRLGVVGRNGLGKTTLVRIMLGLEPPDEGTAVLGPTARPVYVDQGRVALDPERTVYEEVAGERQWVSAGGETISTKAFLSRFLFTGERQQAKVKDLSGGERNRVALAKLLLAAGNVLVLDEPTNDLDLATLRCLEEALVRFEGAAVVVSHDRWFLDRVATRTLAREGEGRWTLVEGGYEDWRALREERAAARAREAREEKEAAARRAASAGAGGGAGGGGAAGAAAPLARGARPARALSAKERNELAGMEAAIEAAEAEAERITRALEDPALYSEAEWRAKAHEHGLALASVRDRIAALYARWDELERRRAGG